MDHPLGQGAVQHLAPLHHVLVLVAVFRRPVKRRLPRFERLVGDLGLEVQAVPKRFQLAGVHFFDLVGGVARLDGGPERPALDRLGEDDGGLAGGLGGRLVGRVELAVVVAAAGQGPQFLVAQVLDKLPQPRVGPKKCSRM